MIRVLVESAFQTGCLSVESEGLLHQMLVSKSYQSDDLAALQDLYEGVRSGQIQREASNRDLAIEFLDQIKFG
ncbi:MAG: hypothetical protein HC908_13500 [Calothrix sp. SM1_7_51]|nr:hypothetical protein [Calothrix sp. SM1_7_51]